MARIYISAYELDCITYVKTILLSSLLFLIARCRAWLKTEMDFAAVESQA